MYKPFYTDGIEYIIVNDSLAYDFSYIQFSKHFRYIFSYHRFVVKAHLNGRKRGFYSGLIDGRKKNNKVKFKGGHWGFFCDLDSIEELNTCSYSLKSHNGHVFDMEWIYGEDITCNDVFILQDHMGNIFILDLKNTQKQSINMDILKTLLSNNASHHELSLLEEGNIWYKQELLNEVNNRIIY